MAITKDKNIITISIEDTMREYALDVNTGILENTRTHHPMHSTPQGLKEEFTTCTASPALYACLSKLPVKSYPEFLSYLQLFEKIDNVLLKTFKDNYKNETGYKYTLSLLDWSSKADINYCLKYFKEYIKFLSDFYKKNYYLPSNLSIFVAEHKRKKMCQDVGIDIEALEDEEKKQIVYLYNALPIARQTPENFLFVFNFVSKQKYLIETLSQWTISSLLNEYLDNCFVMNFTPKNSNNFLRDAYEVKKMYLVNKEELDNQLLADNQLRDKAKIFFEDEDFTTFIPITSNDFMEEATYQHNCVYTCYLQKAMRGECNIIFIRRKNCPNTPYITCEIRNGNIIQFLTRYNRPVTDEKAKDFRKKYENFLAQE